MKKAFLAVSAACALSIFPITSFAESSSNTELHTQTAAMLQTIVPKYPGHLIV